MCVVASSRNKNSSRKGFFPFSLSPEGAPFLTPFSPHPPLSSDTSTSSGGFAGCAPVAAPFARLLRQCAVRRRSRTTCPQTRSFVDLRRLPTLRAPSLHRPSAPPLLPGRSSSTQKFSSPLPDSSNSFLPSFLSSSVARTSVDKVPRRVSERTCRVLFFFFFFFPSENEVCNSSLFGEGNVDSCPGKSARKSVLCAGRCDGGEDGKVTGQLAESFFEDRSRSRPLTRLQPLLGSIPAVKSVPAKVYL